MAAEHEALILDNGQIQLAVRADLGGKLVSLRDASGREWLSRSERPYAERRDGMPYGEGEFDGVDEVFPNLGLGTLTLADGRVVTLRDHGEVWSKSWYALETIAKDSIVLAVDGTDLPYRLERRIHLDGRSVVLAYRLVHTGTVAFPYAYCFHPLFAIQEGMRVELPADQVCRWLYGKGITGLPTATDLPWSQAEAAIGAIHADSGRFWKVVAWGVHNPVRLVAGDGAALSLAWDTAVHPHAAFWCSESGVAGLQHLACEPATSPHDALSDAIADGSARTLSPGEVHTWTITVHWEPAHDPAP